MLVVCLGLSGLLGAQSSAQGSVRLGASEGGGSDADHRWCLGGGRDGEGLVTRAVGVVTDQLAFCLKQKSSCNVGEGILRQQDSDTFSPRSRIEDERAGLRVEVWER